MFLKPGIDIIQHRGEPGMTIPATVFSILVVGQDFAWDAEFLELLHGRIDLRRVLGASVLKEDRRCLFIDVLMGIGQGIQVRELFDIAAKEPQCIGFGIVCNERPLRDTSRGDFHRARHNHGCLNGG